MRSRCFFLAVALSMLSSAQAQSGSLADLLTGTSTPARIQPTELPDSFRAVRLGLSSSGSYLDMMRSMMPWMGSSGASNPLFFSMMDLSWTDGRRLFVEGESFLVTYQIEFDPTRITTSNGRPMDLAGTTLKLVLVRPSAIQTVSPEPRFTKATLLQAIQGDISPMPAAAHTRSLSNLKQLALGVIMYATDADDVMPYVQSTGQLKSVVHPYLKNDELWENLNPNGGRVLFNMALAGVRDSSIPDPSQVVMLFDDKEWPDGKRGVAFADGHAKRVDRAEWQRVSSSLRLKLPRIGRPIK